MKDKRKTRRKSSLTYGRKRYNVHRGHGIVVPADQHDPVPDPLPADQHDPVPDPLLADQHDPVPDVPDPLPGKDLVQVDSPANHKDFCRGLSTEKKNSKFALLTFPDLFASHVLKIVKSGALVSFHYKGAYILSHKISMKTFIVDVGVCVRQ